MLFLMLMCSIVPCASFAASCTLPSDYLAYSQQIPERVSQQFCHPDPGYDPLLLIRAAIKVDAPVFRIIAVKREESGKVLGVRLYQFNKDGNNHEAVKGQPQAVIDFQKKLHGFEAWVKGRKTTISCYEHMFRFKMHGIFGLTINRPLNPEGRVTADGKPTTILLINTSNKDHWRWVLDDGELVHF